MQFTNILFSKWQIPFWPRNLKIKSPIFKSENILKNQVRYKSLILKLNFYSFL